MSYAIVVWDGPAPLSNAHAVSEYERRADADAADPTPPSDDLRNFLGRILPLPSGSGRANRPADPAQGENPVDDEDTSDSAARTVGELMLAGEVDGLVGGQRDGSNDAVWLDPPFSLSPDGSLVILHAEMSQVAAAKKQVVENLEGSTLVAFDPQLGELLPSPGAAARVADFGLPAGGELPLHLAALIGEALDFWTGQAGVIEDVENGFYVQWVTEAGNLTVEVQGENKLPDKLRLSGAGLEQMSDLGFAVDDPNWRLMWPAGEPDVELAAEALARVLAEVRQIPVGAPMRLHTFPVAVR